MALFLTSLCFVGFELKVSGIMSNLYLKNYIDTKERHSCPYPSRLISHVSPFEALSHVLFFLFSYNTFHGFFEAVAMELFSL